MKLIVGLRVRIFNTLLKSAFFNKQANCMVSSLITYNDATIKKHHISVISYFFICDSIDYFKY